MKNKVKRILLGTCCASVLFAATGCMDETFPTSGVTEDQLTSSPQATEALLWAMPAFFNKIGVINASDYHWDWGYGSIMHIRDIMTEDMAITSSSYDHYQPWQQNTSMGKGMIYAQFVWNYYWKFMLTANNMIKAIDTQTATDEQLGYLGAGYAFRAFLYLDMARMFEFLPNDKTNPVNEYGNNVEGYTVPIVRENVTEEEARKNPRVTRQEMADFILSDLNDAENYIVHLDETSKTLPHLDVVYGLKARLYMWLGDYANAKTYARKAIDESRLTPMTEDESLNTKTGFNNINLWMWGAQLTSQDEGVNSGGLHNWASWSSNETMFGYSGAGPYLNIGASLYEQITDTDFRKKMFKAPAGSTLDGEVDFINTEWGAKLPEYASVKFRPAEGNMEVATIGGATAYPIMRVEEMYLIEAEAAAHMNSTEGLELLNNFMKNYRDPNYAYASKGEELINEIILQKRIELWGEGQTFFDVKRLDMSVTRGYSGTNFSDATRFNTNGRPAWMNICIVRLEEDNNDGVREWNNPDPSNVYPLWIE